MTTEASGENPPSLPAFWEGAGARVLLLEPPGSSPRPGLPSSASWASLPLAPNPPLWLIYRCHPINLSLGHEVLC